VPPLKRSDLLAIFAGGCAGALVRAGLATALPPGSGWPWATFAVNVAGAFILALVYDRARLRPLVGTGFCGALTTFSAVQIELFDMLDAGRVGLATAYGAASLAAGYAAVLLATGLVRRA
jgi:CrcB protein